MSGWLTWILAFAVGIDSGATAKADSDVVVVRPTTWSSSLVEWKAFRERQGHRIIEVDSAETAEQTRDRIRDAVRSDPHRAKFILLAADAPAYTERDDRAKQEGTIPAFYIDSKVVKHFGSEPTIVTDYPYSELEPNEERRVSVGRIPATSAIELKDYLARVIRYESSSSFKPWRREVDIVAGIGGFGAITDAIVEGTTRQLLTADIPTEYRLTMTYASPNHVYYPAPHLFSDSIIQRMNDGGLFWIYLGHGYVDTLDFIPHGNQLYSILDRSSLPKVSIPEGPPIGIFLACYVGAFDAREASIAERLLLAPRGPIAIIAGSRVTMPYGMGILGSEMLEKSFRDQTKSIGEILSLAKQESIRDNVKSVSNNDDETTSRRTMLDSMAKALSPEGHSLPDERLEHNYLFNLLGDPMIGIQYPQPLRIETSDEIQAGASLSIHGHSPIAGRLVVELAYTRQRIPESAKQLKLDQRKSNSLDQTQSIYEAANRLTVTQFDLDIPIGDFVVELPIDATCHGSYIVQATVYGADDWSAGSKSILVQRR